MPTETKPGNPLEAFFVHIGSFVAVIVYFALHGTAGPPEQAIRIALPVALAVMTVYMIAAQRRGLLKQFDFGLWPMFAVGTLTVLGGSERASFLFANYSGAILFMTLGLVAVIPPLFGREPFTAYFARRTTPSWQLRTPEFDAIIRIIAAYFAVLFFASAGMAAWAPHDFRFAVLYPNLLIMIGGLPSQLWIPPLYFKLVGVGAPQTAEAAIMGMPMIFDGKATDDAAATIQFSVSGDTAAEYHVRVADGRCESFVGQAAAPNLTIATPDSVWLRIARGELDGAEALSTGLYSVTGDIAVLLEFAKWFPR